MATPSGRQDVVEPFGSAEALRPCTTLGSDLDSTLRSAALECQTPDNAAPERTLSSESQTPKPRVPMLSEDMQEGLDRSLEVIVRKLDTAGGAVLQESYSFAYKHRNWCGKPIHVVAMAATKPAQAESLVARFVEASVDLNEECRTRAGDHDKCCTMAIHLAAGCGNVPVIQALLSHKADVDCQSRVHTDDAFRDHYTPLHEAAFWDQAAAARELISRGARLDIVNLHGERPLHTAAANGCAVVTAVLMQHTEARRHLSHRDTNHGLTPLLLAVARFRFPLRKLHLLACRSLDEVLEVAKISPSHATELIKHQAKSRECGRAVVHDAWREIFPGEAPVKRGNRPPQAGVSSPGSAMRRAKQKLKQVWAVMDEVVEVDVQEDGHAEESQRCTDVWTELLGRAPKVAADLLEIGAHPPRVENEYHNPVPRHARMPRGSLMQCHYGPQEVWGHPSGAWQKALAPGYQVDKKSSTNDDGRSTTFTQDSTSDSDYNSLLGDEDFVPVRVLIVRLPNILSNDVFHHLGNTQEHGIFAKMVTQALVEVVWTSFVKRYWDMHIFWKVIEMFLLLLWVVLAEDMVDFGGLLQFSWSLLFVLSLRELVYEALQVYHMVVIHRRPWQYFGNWGNYVDLTSISLLQAAVWRSAAEPHRYHVCQNGSHDLIAVVLIFRWARFLFTLRAYRVTGTMLLPILRSFLPMGGILIVTLCWFMAFLSAFRALSLKMPVEDRSISLLFTNIFRFFFLGDGTGVDGVMDLGGDWGSGSESAQWNATAAGDEATSMVAPSRIFFMVSTAIFCICIMNLFIAVHGEAYDAAKELAQVQFLSERASICRDSMLRPNIPWRFLEVRGNPWLFLLLSSSALLWSALLLIEDLHAAVPSVVLLAAVLVWDAALLQRPWHHENCARVPCAECRSGKTSERGRNFLWVCVRRDFDEHDFLPGDTGNAALDFQGRLQSLKKDQLLRSQQLGSEIRKVRRASDTRINHLDAKVDALHSKLDDLHSDVKALLQRLPP